MFNKDKDDLLRKKKDLQKEVDFLAAE